MGAVKLLLDTHVIIRGAHDPVGLSREQIDNRLNDVFFSVVSIWEVAIKRGRHPKDFPVDPRILQRGLLDNVYGDIPINSAHDLALFTLPPIHKDPFDRMLVAQAMIEGVTLLTADPVVAQYPGPVRQI